MNEQVKFDVIKSLVDHGCKNKLRASLKLGCTIRTINRMILGYKKQGKSFFIHGNTGRAPVNKTPETLKTKIIKLYKTKYFDANFEHFKELLEENENIILSVSNLTKILESAEIYSPKMTRQKRKRIKIELRGLFWHGRDLGWILSHLLSNSFKIRHSLQFFHWQ